VCNSIERVELYLESLCSQLLDGGLRELVPLLRPSRRGGKEDVLRTALPAEARPGLVLVERQEAFEVDAARHDPDVAACGSERQRRTQVFRDHDRPRSATCGSPRGKNPNVNGEASEGTLRATAEKIASPVLNEHRSIAHGTGRELGHYASVRNVHERWLNPLDCLFELLAKPPVRAGAPTSSIEMHDFDVNAQLTQASNL